MFFLIKKGKPTDEVFRRNFYIFPTNMFRRFFSKNSDDTYPSVFSENSDELSSSVFSINTAGCVSSEILEKTDGICSSVFTDDMCSSVFCRRIADEYQYTDEMIPTDIFRRYSIGMLLSRRDYDGFVHRYQAVFL